MKNIFKYSIYAFLCVICFSSCRDFVERDIKNNSVNVKVPTNGAVLTNATVSFIWDEIKDATSYNLQIVKPNFSSIQSFIIDSNVTGTKFTQTLLPGKYQFRIKAMNGSSYTPYTTVSFSIDSSLSMSNQLVQLISPLNTNSGSLHQLFKWTKIQLADDYRIEIYDQSGSLTFMDASVKTDTISVNFTKDGTYKWKVRAQNSTSVSLYSESNVTIDNTAPGIPTLIAPANNDSSIIANLITLKAPVTFTWNRGANAGTIIKDSLYVYKNSSSSTPIKSIYTPDSTHVDTLLKGTYFWKVRSIDAVGNKSSYSSIFKFIIK